LALLTGAVGQFGPFFGLVAVILTLFECRLKDA
jgi:hypothetical protein